MFNLLFFLPSMKCVVIIMVRLSLYFCIISKALIFCVLWSVKYVGPDAIISKGSSITSEIINEMTLAGWAHSANLPLFIPDKHPRTVLTSFMVAPELTISLIIFNFICGGSKMRFCRRNRGIIMITFFIFFKTKATHVTFFYILQFLF